MTMDSWGDMARTIAEQSHAAWIYFVMFVSFAGLGLMNLLTAVFVEALIEQVLGLHPVLLLHPVLPLLCRAATCAAVLVLGRAAVVCLVPCGAAVVRFVL